MKMTRVALAEPRDGVITGQPHRYRYVNPKLEAPLGVQSLTVPSGVSTLLRPNRYDASMWAQLFVGSLADRDEKLCTAALDVLLATGWQASPDEAIYVATLLDDPIRALRPKSLRLLSRLDPDTSIETVLDALDQTTHENLWQGKAAIEALGEFETEQAVEALLRIANLPPSDPRAPLRADALQALGKVCPYPTTEVAGTLISALCNPRFATGDEEENEDYTLVFAAIKAIEQWQSQPPFDDATALTLIRYALGIYRHIARFDNYEDVETFEKTFESLLLPLFKSADADRYWALLMEEAQEDPHGERLAQARVWLDSSDDEEAEPIDAPSLQFVEDLLSKASDGSLWQKRIAWETLCEFGPYAPVERLEAIFRQRALGKQESGVWGNNDYELTVMVEALDTLGERAPIGVFVDLLTGAIPGPFAHAAEATYSSSGVLRVALDALGKRAKQGEFIPREPFLIAARHRNPFLRARAIELLAELETPEMEELIVPALCDDEGIDGRLRATAARVAQHLGERAPIAELVAAIGDSDDEVRQAACETLLSIAPAALRDVQREAIGILAGEGIGKTLGSIVQTEAAKQIAHYRRADPALLATLADLLEWPNGQTQTEAAKALGQLQRNIPDRAIRRLLALCRESPSITVRQAAEDALAEILTLEAGLEDEG